ncbi:hypothetical protein B296_00025542 [Ensete ventricosum]|uniref:Uncharacterized protein n=1 Tax=Ensete ventricosum TaxID=4639 RepID=A0A427AST9_ENSVE|nr:hypothetical protein B296_00025542 [Ensete ventricosum]
MNSCGGKGRIMTFHEVFILMEQTHPAWCQRRRELRGIYTLSQRSIDEETKTTQLDEVKLGSEGFNTGQEEQRPIILKNMPQCCHSSCHEESGAVVIVGMTGATKELDCSSAYSHLRELDKSKDTAKGGTSVELSILCSHGGRALVMKRAKKTENTEANFKYQDKAEKYRLGNFIRPMSTGFSSR